jgi:hypothetical protein
MATRLQLGSKSAASRRGQARRDTALKSDGGATHSFAHQQQSRFCPVCCSLRGMPAPQISLDRAGRHQISAVATRRNSNAAAQLRCSSTSPTRHGESPVKGGSRNAVERLQWWYCQPCWCCQCWGSCASTVIVANAMYGRAVLAAGLMWRAGRLLTRRWRGQEEMCAHGALHAPLAAILWSGRLCGMFPPCGMCGAISVAMFQPGVGGIKVAVAMLVCLWRPLC